MDSVQKLDSDAGKTQEEWMDKMVKGYRQKQIHGRFVDLVPFGEEWIEDFIKLRNVERNLYFFNQTYKLTSEDQREWYQKYLQRNDDILWCILNKKNQLIGSVRLYQIQADGSAITHGSFMVDEKVADEAPYALEAEVISLNIAFDVLHTKQVICENRNDNEVMNSLSEKTGYTFIKHTSIRGVPYRYYVLFRDAYEKKREKIERTLDHWARYRNGANVNTDSSTN